MKSIILKHRLLVGVLSLFMALFVAVSCDDDDPIGFSPTADLQTLITEAENLIATSEEGTSPGDFQPGSKEQLQKVLTWVNWALANSTEESELNKAEVRLQRYIDIFKSSTVSLAIPIFDNSTGSWIEISENIKPLLADNFTIEIESYFAGAGWIETMFSAGEGDDGSQFGFNLRIFGDRLDLVVGSGGWHESYITDGQGISIGEWVHYAVTKSGTVWKVYMNGVEVISEANFPSETFFRSSVPFVLGETPFWPGRAWNGMLRDFRVWSEVRTADQIIAMKDEQLEGTEQGLEVYFPLDTNLGSNFTDNTGNYTAKFVGNNISWAPDGIPPVIVLDYSSINMAIEEVKALKDEVVEGVADGDYPVGTKDYLQSIISDSEEVKANAKKQDELDNTVTSINDKLKLVKKYLVADANGVYVDRENPSAVGLRITPNYTPQGDYTVEFDLKLKTLQMSGSGEIFGNGAFGLRVFGYAELTEEALRNAGGLWNFTSYDGEWQGPEAPPLTMKSNEWQHVAIVHDEAAMTTRIFVDGVEVGTQTGIGHPVESGWGEIWLGNSWGEKMNGTIKDFRIWDAVKAPGDLDAGIDGTETNLRIYFPLDKVAGIKFNDVTGNYKAELRGIEWEK